MRISTVARVLFILTSRDRPSGNLIASTQRLPHKYQVVFFEKNGLRHGEFSLRADRKRVVVTDLTWNADSSVLAVLFHETSGVDYVQLWTTSNYHWYMKQEIRFHNDNISTIAWDNEAPLLLHIDTASGRYHRFKYAYTTYRNTAIASGNLGGVAVVDGQNLLVTPFRGANVPPPMAYQTISFSENIASVSFSPKSVRDGNAIAVLVTSGEIYICTPHGDDMLMPTRFAAIRPPEGILFPRQIFWTGPNTLSFLCYDQTKSRDVIKICEAPREICNISESNGGKLDVKIVNLDLNVSSMIYSVEFGRIIVQTVVGELFEGR